MLYPLSRVSFGCGYVSFRCHYGILNQLLILISIKKPPDIYWHIPSLVFCWEYIDPRIFQLAHGSEDTVMCFYKGKSVFSSCLSKAATVIEIKVSPVPNSSELLHRPPSKAASKLNWCDWFEMYFIGSISNAFLQGTSNAENPCQSCCSMLQCILGLPSVILDIIVFLF